MTQAVRIALLLLAGHVAVLVVAATRVFAGQPPLADKLLLGAYALIVAATTVVVARRDQIGFRLLLRRETPTFALPQKDESRATGDISHWIDPVAVDELEARVARLGEERDRISTVLREVSACLRHEPAEMAAVKPWILELVEAGVSDRGDTAEKDPIEAPAIPEKPDAIVLLRLDPVKAEASREGDEPDRVVFSSRGRLTSKARVMLQKLGNRLRRDTGARED